MGTVPGEDQTVPRAELLAILEALIEVPPSLPVTLFSDHLNWVRAFGVGKEEFRRKLHTSKQPAHADLWLDLWHLVRARLGPTVLGHVISHPEVGDVAAADHDLGAFVVNAAADAVAGLAAKDAELPSDAVIIAHEILTLAALVVDRISRVATMLFQSKPDPDRVLVPARAAPRIRFKDRLLAARRTTQHCFQVVDRVLRCRNCWGVSRAQKQIAWLCTPCPGINLGGPEGSPHPTHVLRGGRFLCSASGAGVSDGPLGSP